MGNNIIPLFVAIPLGIAFLVTFIVAQGWRLIAAAS